MKVTYYSGCEDGGKRREIWKVNHQHQSHVERREVRILLGQLNRWRFHLLRWETLKNEQDFREGGEENNESVQFLTG